MLYANESHDRNVTNCDDCGAWLYEGADCPKCLADEDRFGGGGWDAVRDAIGNCVFCGALTQLDGQFCSGVCADAHEAECAAEARRMTARRHLSPFVLDLLGQLSE